MATASRTWATQRLDELVHGQATILPPVIQTLRLGALDEWGVGWIKKGWLPHQDLLNVDGSLFGGYIAALADQALAFAAMTVVPADSVFRTVNLNVNFIRVVELIHLPSRRSWSPRLGRCLPYAPLCDERMGS
jgi:acyl-coenzyme A thioesterase PaaI-like protein